MQINEYLIELTEIHLYAHHGVMLQEREVGAWFTLNARLHIGNSSCTSNDEISGTVSYADIYEIICREMKIPSNLLEHVCKRICESIYSSFDDVMAIEITLCKDTPPMNGDRMGAGVTLKTTR